jgi:hypothetical protein
VKSVQEILAEIDRCLQKCESSHHTDTAYAVRATLKSLGWFIVSGEKCPTTGGKHDLVDTGACGIMGCLNCEYETK